ncbi:MAG: hypothetical protein ACLTG2_08915 [Clostridia bacterium]
MICSTGLDNSTITGDYTIGIKSNGFPLWAMFSEDTSAEFGDYLSTPPYYQ